MYLHLDGRIGSHSDAIHFSQEQLTASPSSIFTKSFMIGEVWITLL